MTPRSARINRDFTKPTWVTYIQDGHGVVKGWVDQKSEGAVQDGHGVVKGWVDQKSEGAKFKKKSFRYRSRLRRSVGVVVPRPRTFSDVGPGG